MTRAERLAAALVGVPVEDRLRGREVKEAGELPGLSTATVYRLIAEGKLGHVKADEAERGNGRGKAGAVRVRLLDIVEYQVAHEVVAVVADVPREREAIKRMLALHRRGKSLAFIVADLEARKVPTRSGKPWTRASVLVILRRETKKERVK